MRRTTLFSFMVIGAALAVLFGAGTFASFSDSDNIAGDVSAGVLQVDITESDGTQVITFDPTASCGELTPEEDCTVTLRVQHDSSTLGGSNLEFTYVATLVETGTDTNGCFTPTFTGGSAISPADNLDFSIDSATVFSRSAQNNTTNQGDATDALDPAEYDEALLTIDLSDNNNCQGVGPITYTVTVVATQSSTPHD